MHHKERKINMEKKEIITVTKNEKNSAKRMAAYVLAIAKHAKDKEAK